MFNIALRNIFRHKVRSLISLSTIAFGCVALMFIGGFFENNLFQMREGYINTHIGHLQVFQKGFNKNSAISPYKYLIKEPQAIVDTIARLPEVKSIGSRLQFAGLISTGKTSAPCWVQGVDVRFDRTFKMKDYKDIKDFMNHKDVYGLGEIAEGEGLYPGDNPFTTIVGVGLADALNVAPVGYVTVMNTTIQGGNNAMDLLVNGTLQTASKDFDDVFIRVPLATAQKMLNTSSVQNIVVKLKHTEDTAKVKKKLEFMFNAKHFDLEISTWDDISDFYAKTVQLFGAFHWVMRIVISIAVILGIFNTMNMAVMERFSEIGTIMAMGVKRGGVLKLFLYEGLLLGLIGGTCGVILGCVFVYFIGNVGIVMPPPPGTTSCWLSQPSIEGDVIVFAFILSIVIGGISSLVPALKASRLTIVEALRYR